MFAKAARSTHRQRVRRDQFGVPVITQQEQARLPGVNVAQWADPRVEREVYVCTHTQHICICMYVYTYVYIHIASQLIHPVRPRHEITWHNIKIFIFHRERGIRRPPL